MYRNLLARVEATIMIENPLLRTHAAGISSRRSCPISAQSTQDMMPDGGYVQHFRPVRLSPGVSRYS